MRRAGLLLACTLAACGSSPTSVGPLSTTSAKASSSQQANRLCQAATRALSNAPRILVLKYQNDIYSMNPDGTALQNLTSNQDTLHVHNAEPSWSPDQARIAFASDRDGGGWNYYVMNADGTHLTRLGDLTTDDPDEATWAPSGTRLALLGRGSSGLDLYVINADGKAIRRLSRNGNHVGHSWSPEESAIATTSAPASGRFS